MVAQGRVIATWGKNVHVKLPVTTTRGEPLYEAVRTLSRDGVKINMTAIFTPRAGREGGRRARRRRAGLRFGLCRAARRSRHRLPPDHAGCGSRARARRRNIEIIWASTREVFNVVEADEMGCHIITAPADILKKLPALGTKTGAELSLDAVKAFRDDAVAAGLRLDRTGRLRSIAGKLNGPERFSACNV